MDAFAFYAANRHCTTIFRRLKLHCGPQDLYLSRIRCKPLSSNVLLLGTLSRPPILSARTIKRLLLRFRKCLQRAPKHRSKGAVRDIRHISASLGCLSRKFARLPRGQLPDQMLRSKSWYLTLVSIVAKCNSCTQGLSTDATNNLGLAFTQLGLISLVVKLGVRQLRLFHLRAYQV